MPKRSRSGVLLLVTLLPAVVLLGSAHSSAAEPSPTPTFSFPEDDEPILTVSSQSPRLTRSLSLYASGTAQIKESRANRVAERTLSGFDIESILSEIVRGDLSNYDLERLEATKRTLAPGRLTGTSSDSDLPLFSVSFRLIAETPGTAEPARVEKTIKVYGPYYLAQRFPTIPEYQALAFLERLIIDRPQTDEDAK